MDFLQNATDAVKRIKFQAITHTIKFGRNELNQGK